MRTDKILKGVDDIEIIGELPETIENIKIDSREVRKNDCFIAISGEREDGHKFLIDAKEKGASVFVVEKDTDLKPHIRVIDTKNALARISANYYDEPSLKMKIFGITGTNGKTTTAFILKNIYKDAALISTIGYFVKNNFYNALNTTPNSIIINKMLSEALNLGIKSAIIEVSSHSLVQKRVEYIKFNFAIFTNLTRDHLDYHKSFENYRDAKSILFSKLNEGNYAVLNYEDPSTEFIISKTKSRVITFGLNGGNVKGNVLKSNNEGLELEVSGLGVKINLKTKIIGRYNALNILAAVATAILDNIDKEIIKEGVEKFDGVRGRLEKIDLGQGFNIFIDYAHTPDAMANVIATVKEFTEGDVVVLFGAGGNRDKGKRKLMGALAENLADRIILTSDNPRDENVNDIISMIAEGIEKKKYDVILDRNEAIRFAIKNCKESDTLLVLGKGHEEYQEIKGNKISFSDKKVVEQSLLEEGYGTK